MTNKFLSKEIEEVEKELGIKSELFRKWLFEDNSLISNYSNYFIEYCELKSKLQTLKLAQADEKKKHDNFVDEIKKLVDCMNPDYCGCKRCPNCVIFYNKLKDKLSEV